MKKSITLLTLIFLVVSIMFGCNSNSNNNSNEELKFEQLNWPTYDNAQQIPIPKSTSACVRNCNDVSFDFYLENTAFEDYQEYVEECKAKGFTIEPTEQDYQYHAFNSAEYELTVRYQNDNIMYVRVVEKRIDVEIKILHTNTESSNRYNLRVEVDGYWEEDSEQGDEVIFFDSYLKEGKHTLTIENDDDDDINGKLDFIISDEIKYIEFEITCLSNKIVINKASNPNTSLTNSTTEQSSQTTDIAVPLKQLTLSEARDIFDDVFSKYSNLVDEFSELLNYGNENTFTSIEEINDYEQQWEGLSSTAYELADMLLAKTPPNECKLEWETFADKLIELGGILNKASNLDTNFDNHYDSSEVSSIIEAVRNEFVINGEEIIDVAAEFNNITKDENSSTQSSTTPSSNKKCIECGKKATKTYTNPFSGQKEYYCQSHYNKLLDMMGDMFGGM